MTRPPAVAAPATVRVQDGRTVAVAETVAVEVPIALSYNGVPHAVMLASPADLEDFAVGFSLTEGLVADAAEIGAIACGEIGVGLTLDVAVPAARLDRVAARARSIAGGSGCGLCGVVAIEAALRDVPPLARGAAVPAGAIGAALAALPARQRVNRLTGAMHAAAFADRSGELLLVREDVGRHNALDKLIGAVVRGPWRATDGFVVVTSRCSMEMVQKTAAFGCPLIAAVSAPTSLAIALAARCGLGLVAFARASGFNVYAGAERIAAP